MKRNKITLAEFFDKNEELIINFGEYFLAKLTDKELLDNLAERDLEKLARIFKLLFEKAIEEDEKKDTPLLGEILNSINKNKNFSNENMEI